MNYANAWNCKECPKRSDEQGCPAWTRFVETNTETGEDRITEGCMIPMLPRLLGLVIVASNRGAASVESLRNVHAEGVARIAEVVNKIPKLIN